MKSYGVGLQYDGIFLEEKNHLQGPPKPPPPAAAAIFGFGRGGLGGEGIFCFFPCGACWCPRSLRSLRRVGLSPSSSSSLFSLWCLYLWFGHSLKLVSSAPCSFFIQQVFVRYAHYDLLNKKRTREIWRSQISAISGGNCFLFLSLVLSFFFFGPLGLKKKKERTRRTK